MSLRLTLLLRFTAGALVALIFFGYIAYDTAKLTGTKNEIALLAGVAPYVTENINGYLQREQNWEPVLPAPHGKHSHDVIHLVISNHQGVIITQSKALAIQDAFQKIQQATQNSASTNSGSITLDDAIYIWAKALLPDKKSQVTLIRQAYISQANVFFKEMGISLIIAAMITLWVASWAAMYVSMLMEKLDEQNNALQYQALHDVLTDLPNRALLNDRSQQLIKSCERNKALFAICIIDLNHFKDINDTLGHHVGDELLLEVSNRLKKALRKSDTIARLGGDEFSLLLPCTDAESAKLIAEKILQSIAVPLEIDGQQLLISGSLGLALYPNHGNDIHTLMKKADMAMYAAKRTGIGVEIYNKQHEINDQNKQSLTNSLPI